MTRNKIIIVTFIFMNELLVCTRQMSRRLYVRNLVWSPNRPKKYWLYQIRIVDQKSIDFAYSNGKSIMIFSISKEIYLTGMHMLKIFLSEKEMWNMCGCTIFPCYGFYPTGLFLNKVLKRQQKHTQIIDTWRIIISLSQI